MSAIGATQLLAVRCELSRSVVSSLVNDDLEVSDVSLLTRDHNLWSFKDKSLSEDDVIDDDDDDAAAGPADVRSISTPPQTSLLPVDQPMSTPPFLL